MKITDVRARHLSLPQIAERCDGTQDTLIVEVVTDAGISGVGEVDTSPLVGKAAIEAPYSNSITSGLRELVVGEDPFAYERIWQKMYLGSRYSGRRGAFVHAMSGVDIALWDVMGKAVGSPVHRLLGGAMRRELRPYASTLFGSTLRATADRAKWCMDQGFAAVKFGWDPLGQDPDYDVALVEAIREAIGPKAELMIDAGHAWPTKTAIQMAERFRPFGLYWLEEPLLPDNVEGYARLATSTSTRIAAGEAESNRVSYQDLMDRGRIDVVQIDVTRVGGLSEAKKIAWAAYDRGREVVNHSFTTDINLAASLHMLAVAPEAKWVEYCVEDSPLRRELVRNPPLQVDGMVRVPEGPGLGIELDWETVERYTVRG